MMKNCVVIEARDVQGALVSRDVFTLSEWYDQERPIIDSALERANKKITNIKGWQFDGAGNIVSQWASHYSLCGGVIDHTEIREDGSVWKWEGNAMVKVSRETDDASATNSTDNEQFPLVF